ncbi:MAG: Adenylyl cyclase class-3/4/guanylyl cyclase [Nocardioidaceae bacterium]|nr:Adenylyl cyclase class-3/4/guanylyl cyclase [Nocardioidaceae bacterium]
MTDPPSPEELLDAVEQLLLGGAPSYTRVQVAEQVGIPLETAAQLWHSLGFAHTTDDEVVFTDLDVTALRATVRLIDAGILDEESQVAMVRTWGRSFARLADWQTELLGSVAAASDDPEARLAELAVEVIPVVDELQSYIWRRHLLSAAGRNLLRPSGAGTVRAVGFVDIVGYTTQSKNLDQPDLVALVEHFEEVSTSTTTDHGGLVVKTIGDEVLYVVDDPTAAARIALELVERHADDPLFPEVRAGVALGSVVSRLGDVFGPTVNIAARLTSVARPGTVVVDAGMHEALEAGEDFRLRRLRRTSVKGYSRLEPWRLKRSHHAADDD